MLALSSPQGDAAKVILYILGSFLLAALLSPPLYHLGKGFASVTIHKDTTDGLAWFAGKLHKHGFETYFKRALILSAVLLLFPLLSALRLGVNHKTIAKAPWSIHLHPRSIARYQGQPITNPRLGWLLTPIGFLLASSFLFAMGWYLLELDYFRMLENPPWKKAIQRAIGPSIAASVIEEVIFRGALLGIFIRAFRPTWGIILLSFIFAAVHFLQPPEGVTVSNPGSLASGFEMLGLIGQKFLDPIPMLYGFATLFLLGLVLGYARYATASLWLPIGIHAGLVFALKIYNRTTYRRTDLPEKLDLYIGETLQEGLIPLVTLIIMGIVIYFLTRFISVKKKAL